MTTPTDDMNEDNNGRLNEEQRETVDFLTKLNAVWSALDKTPPASQSADIEKPQNDATDDEDASSILDTARPNYDDTENSTSPNGIRSAGSESPTTNTTYIEARLHWLVVDREFIYEIWERLDITAIRHQQILHDKTITQQTKKPDDSTSELNVELEGMEKSINLSI